MNRSVLTFCRQSLTLWSLPLSWLKRISSSFERSSPLEGLRDSTSVKAAINKWIKWFGASKNYQSSNKAKALYRQMVPMREMVSEQIKSFPKSISLGKKYASALQISNCAVAWTGDNRKKSKAKEKKNSCKDDKSQEQASPNATTSHLPGGMCNLKRSLSLSVKVPLYMVSVRGKRQGSLFSWIELWNTS